MYGIYLGIEKTKILEFIELRKSKNNMFNNVEMIPFPRWINRRGYLIKRDFESNYIIEDKNSNVFACISGMIIYNKKSNNLSEFIDEFLINGKEILSKLDGGNYFIYIFNNGIEYIITDMYGQNPHYIDEKGNVAPTPFFLVNNETKHNKLLLNIYKKRSYIFGNYTVFEGINRLDPGSLFIDGVREKYYYPCKYGYKFNPGNVYEQLIESISYIESEESFLPITGGMDSRFILASGKYKYGFTYGPKDSGDRLFAEPFKKYFQKYICKSILEFDLKSDDFKESQIGTYGVALNSWINLGIYRELSNIIDDKTIVIDGFAGDALTHNHYFDVDNKFFKLFPDRLKKYSIYEILKMRYSNFDENEMKLLLKTFNETTHELSYMDDAHKLWYFEFIYGRGAKYIYLNTKNINHYFRSYQPFLYKDLFENLFSQDPFESSTYKNIRKIWKNVGDEYSRKPTDSGFIPLDSGMKIRFTKYINKISAKLCKKLGYHNKYKDYVGEVNIFDNKFNTSSLYEELINEYAK